MNCSTLSDEYGLPDRSDFRAIMTVERVGKSEQYPSCVCLREHSVCTASATDLQQSLVDAHAPVVAIHPRKHVPAVFGTMPHGFFVTDSQNIGRSMMESTERGVSKSDPGLGIVDTACLFCVAPTGGRTTNIWWWILV